MSQKQILWLCSWYPSKTDPFNGDFIQRHAKAAALYNDIYVIHVATDTTGLIKKKTVEIKREQGLTEHIIIFKKTSSAWGRLIAHYRLLFQYRDAIKNYIRSNGKPDLAHVHIPIKAGLIGLWLKKRSGIPYVVTEHWGIYNEVEELNYASRSKAFKHYTKAIISKAAKFISVSRYLAEGVNRLVVKKEYDIIPNVVDTELFYHKSKETSLFRFIHISNMVPLKNAEGILRAFKLFNEQNKNAELIMVGNTNPAISRYAGELGLGTAVQFRGEISYAQVAKEMQVSDCLVLFSNIENSPCVIGEALCCGLPVIATAVGGVPELLDQTNGILIPPRDEDTLAVAMQQMINIYQRFERKQIADKAKNKFSYPVIGKKLNEIYSAVVH